MRNFVAVDGEAVNIGEDHLYVLLASSSGEYEFDSKGLGTERCLEFLLRESQGATLVAFGWNYDANMIFRDIDPIELVKLWHNGKITWNGYKIEWIPSKWLAVRRGKYFAKVSDVFGFFQCSFVEALRRWDIEPQPELAEMKAKRSTFDMSMKRRIIDYCLGECRDLVSLMGEVEQALCDVDLALSTWVGAGSIASKLLRKYKIDKARVPDHEWTDYEYSAIMGSYYGGRSEMFRQGIFPEVYNYDISSAYPAQAMELPVLTDGKWRRVRKYRPDQPYALWKCRWELPDTYRVCPFPVRHKYGIYYPRNGEGWYHAAEVAAAMRLCPDGIDVRAGLIFTPASNERPFAFIREVYDERAKLKEAGHGGEKVLKLGLNSLYGKLAQGQGFGGKAPPFQSYLWAGMITAGTRAIMVNLAALDPDALIMMATDGIFFTRPIDVPVEGGLGGLELTVGEDVFVAQPGIYSYSENGEEVGKTRGFFSREVDFHDLREGYEREGAEYVAGYESTRFCGLGYAILRGDLSAWRKWHTSTRHLTLYPSRKFVTENGNGQLLPPRFDPLKVSEPYKPKIHPMLADEEAAKLLVDYIQGVEQPLRSES